MVGDSLTMSKGAADDKGVVVPNISPKEAEGSATKNSSNISKSTTKVAKTALSENPKSRVE